MSAAAAPSAYDGERSWLQVRVMVGPAQCSKLTSLGDDRRWRRQEAAEDVEGVANAVDDGSLCYARMLSFEALSAESPRASEGNSLSHFREGEGHPRRSSSRAVSSAVKAWVSYAAAH